LLNKGHDYFHRVRFRQLSNAFACVSHLTIRERIKLFELGQHGKLIAEIGSYVGASACCFGAALLENKDGKIFCIDTWNNDSMTEGYRDTWAEFCLNTKKYSKFIVPVRGISVQVANEVCQYTSKLDLLFIDGNHSYEGVKSDWETYKKFLFPGSLVVFHDYGWADGVQRVIQEDVLANVSFTDRLPNMWWGTINKNP
jgi:predicted O-methyltransferase YrrM